MGRTSRPLLERARCARARGAGGGIYTTAETAEGLGITDATVRRRLAELEHKVFDLTGIPPSRGKLATWVRRKFDCCTRDAREMIENDQIFG
ncbi:MAG: DeoR family transcriptional regulator [Chloroflexi bacterium]|nr:DeoR family transcriptional regulator [Chloroflexota bacterium]